MRLGHSFLVILFAVTGCATPGDPSCDVYNEINDDCHLKQALYHPELDVVGLQKTAWYNCPNAWAPECPGFDCRLCESTSRMAVSTVDPPSINPAVLSDGIEVPPPAPLAE